MVVTALIDLLLVLVYMNWLHPWRGILEDVSMSLDFNIIQFWQKGPEIWGPLTDEEGAPEVPIQSEDQENMLMKYIANEVSRCFFCRTPSYPT